jgi:subtilisin family serine protease
MSRRSVVLSVLGAFALAACSDAPTTAPGGAPSLAAAPSAAGSRYLVLMKGNGVASDFGSRVAALGGKLESSHAVGFAVVSGLTPAAAASLGKQKDVGEVQADVQFTLDVAPGDVDVASDAAPASPTAPSTAFFYPRQWHLRAIGAEKAWAAGRLGSPQVTVAILDTGIDPTVPDLVGRVDESRSTSFVPDDSFDEYARSIVFPSKPKYTDLHFHGTHVAATVSSNAVVAAGVTSNVTLVAVKVLGLTQDGNGSGSLEPTSAPTWRT